MALDAKSIKYEIEITERGFVKLTEKISGLQRYLKDANAASTRLHLVCRLLLEKKKTT